MQNGADIEAKDNQDMTPILWAAFKGHLSIAKYLLGKGSNFNSKAFTDQNALDLAEEKGHTRIVDLLKSHM